MNPPFSKILRFLEIQDIPTFHSPISNKKVLKDRFNRVVYNFYPQSILILEEYLTKVVKCKLDIMPLNVFFSIF